MFDYSRDGILRSLDDSLARLQLDSVEIALMHDPDSGQSMSEDVDVEPTYFRQAMDEAYPTLQRLKSEGVLKAVGVGMNQWQALARFARAADFDCFLLAGRYTLLDQSALPTLMPLCEEKRISLILGGPYNSGILASETVARRDVLLRRSPRRRPGPGAGHPGRVRPARCAPESRRASVRSCPSRRGEHDTRRPVAGGGRGEREDGRVRHP